MDVYVTKRSLFPSYTEVSLPASKSISNRLLIIQYLSGNKLKIENLSVAEDTLLMQKLLSQLTERVNGVNTDQVCSFDCGNAGTVLRFLTALLAIQPGTWIVTGSERMKKRPVHSLCDALIQSGASIEYLENEGYPPVKISGRTLYGGRVSIDASQSSQFISALLMIAPFLKQGLTLQLKNEAASRPYIDMTLALMKKAGIKTFVNDNLIKVEPGNYFPASFVVEPDWSSASYWFEMAAMLPEGEILLKNLSLESIQGDAVLPKLFLFPGLSSEQISRGVLIRKVSDALLPDKEKACIKQNLSNYPDLAPAIAATCTGLNFNAILSGLNNLRIKESNRLDALYNELVKINPSVKIVGDDSLHVDHREAINHQETPYFNTYNDHRMAMAFAPLALKYSSVTVKNAGVVSKSYPSYWHDLEKYFTLDFIQNPV